jgi:class 3 adenylate cyclase/DNA-binding SARP family transcriptional activator
VLPVVMVTALDPAEERVKGLEAGADDFLVKPINSAELLARVRSLLRVKAFHDTVQAQAAELASLNAGLEQRVQHQLVELQRLAQLKRFFPPHLAERIVAGDEDDPLATHRREVAVVVLDLRGFTAFADTAEPEDVMGLLRRYHAEMGGIIQARGGTLEQFTGSTMLVVFNDPVVVEDPAGRAVRMALEMQQRFGDLIGPWRKLGHEIALGIGIAHGYATIGAIGHEGRAGYGVIGRVTNLASRLGAEARPGEILVSAPVLAQVESVVDAEAADHVNLDEFARPVAAHRVLRLKPAAAPAREWPLKILAFGQFSLQREGEPIVFSRKVQKRPLDLLKALIARGGIRVDSTGLIGALWPEAEGDAARLSFDSNLHRLRKLVGADDLITLAEGRLSLDASRCWVDVWAFEEAVARIDRWTHDATGGDGAEPLDLVAALLRLYRGHFLENETQDAWAVAARDRLKAKFIRAVTDAGQRLEERGQWDQCATLYGRALELDNLAEGLHRRLMITYRELGEPAEALKVYRRCRDMLSIVLGVAPGPETEAIRASLR